MITTYERDTIAEIRARLQRGQRIEDWEKQLVLDMLRREGEPVRAEVIERARNSGFNVAGIRSL